MSKLTKQNVERLEREIEIHGEMIEDLKTIAGFDRVKKDQLILLFINLLHEAGGNLPNHLFDTIAQSFVTNDAPPLLSQKFCHESRRLITTGSEHTQAILKKG